MGRTLEIERKSPTAFWHIDNGDVDSRFNISDFEVSIDGMDFNIVEKDGATRFTYNINDISLKDTYVSGTVYTYPNDPEGLRNKLESWLYTPYLDLLSSLAAFISTDAGNTLVIGTDGKLYVPTSGGGTAARPRWVDRVFLRKGAANTVNLNVDEPGDYFSFGMADGVTLATVAIYVGGTFSSDASFNILQTS